MSGATRRKKTSRSHRRRRGTMRCSPIVDGKTTTDDTCYTDDILLKLRDAYHKNHPNQPPIATNVPKQIHRALQQRLQATCPATEDCWLQELPTAQRQYIDKQLFAPDQPMKWSKNPQEWLSNYDIERVLHQYEVSHPHFVFIGPTPIDFDTRVSNPAESGGNRSDGGYRSDKTSCVWNDLCQFDLAEYKKRGKTHIGIIFNLDTHTQDGSHWVSMFIRIPCNNDNTDGQIYYFDSACNPTPPQIRAFVKRVQKQMQSEIKYDENYPNMHQRSNTECGMYSLYFIITMLKTTNPALMWNRRFKHGTVPDRTMIRLRNVYYNKPSSSSSLNHRRRSKKGGAGDKDSEKPLNMRDGIRAKVVMGVRRSLLDIMDKQRYNKQNSDKEDVQPYVSRVTPHIGYIKLNPSYGSYGDQMDIMDEWLAQIVSSKPPVKIPMREYHHLMDVPGLSDRYPLQWSKKK